MRKSKLARWIFLIAGIWGILVLAPQYFLETFISSQHPPAITHPEFFYGFIGVGLAWQILFLLISTDPVRYRGAMLSGVVEKLSFVSAIFVLYAANRVDSALAGAAAVDLLLGIMFVIAFVKTGNPASSASNRNG